MSKLVFYKEVVRFRLHGLGKLIDCCGHGKASRTEQIYVLLMRVKIAMELFWVVVLVA